MWYAWTIPTDFEAWHQNVIDALQLPRVGFNAASGKPQPEAQQTLRYTDPFDVDGETRAYVQEHIAAQFAAGLGTPSQPPPPPPNDF